MLRYFSADYVLPISALPIRNGIVAVDNEGVIRGVFSPSEVSGNIAIEKLSGTLIPGFVNAHCHLELSHLKGIIPEHTGLVDFILAVMENRKKEDKAIEKAMKAADELMYANGIQAVGDHVNTAVSASVKNNSKMLYHTFVETIGIRDDQAEEKIDEAKDIEFHFNQTYSSITPHAPYSCSKTLFKMFKKATSEHNILSIHNQESEEENKFFRYKTGEFLRFYDTLGVDYSSFRAQARNSIQSFLPLLPSNNKIILVHNTFTSVKDVDFVHRMNKNVMWCLCPKANLYIENTLPKVNLLMQEKEIVIGTDSFASNSTLDIFEEIKVLHAHFPELDVLTTLRWATLNGAKALGIDQSLGSLEVGKTPGLILLKDMTQLRLTDDVKVQRIV